MYQEYTKAARSSLLIIALYSGTAYSHSYSYSGTAYSYFVHNYYILILILILILYLVHSFYASPTPLCDGNNITTPIIFSFIRIEF